MMHDSMQDTRTHVVGELYDTERSYVGSLQILIEKYMKPLKGLESNKILIDSNLVDEIFYTIPEILKHHEHFLSALQSRLSSDWDSSQIIGNVFIEAFTNQQIIDTYTAFINNWKNARQAIKVAIQAKPAFEKFLEAMSREHRNKLTLDALLIMPVQRIPRYELLIKELIKHTPEDHPDYHPLIEAQKQIHELALKIDQAEKEMIHQEQLKDLESLIEGHIELQHPQRDFIRYDLVTIVGSSSLTVAKKERVLFLFCDLLIMTSVKKKVSRRSNLQNAFANSSNDLTLLEGNKFKLLLRVPIDQLEIRVENETIQYQQSKQELQQDSEQQQTVIAQQKKLINEQRCEIEADLYILHQIDSMATKLMLVERNKIIEVVNSFTNELREKLHHLEHSEAQAMTLASSQPVMQHPALIAQGSCVAQSPTNISQSPGHQKSLQQFNALTALNSPIHTPDFTTKLQSSPSASSTSTANLIASATSIVSSITTQQDTDTSLELIISSYPGKEALNNHLSSSSVTSDFTANSDSQNSSSQQATYESVVVTFASIENRQAFVQAFIEAKQQRYFNQQRNQRHIDNKIFSSSITVRLSQPESPQKSASADDSRHKHHQDNIELRPIENMSASAVQIPQRVSQALCNSTNTRLTSNAHGKQQGTNSLGTIVHQMSAPQSITSETSYAEVCPMGCKRALTLSSSHRCTSCSSNLATCNDGSVGHHHHHHQLMHQPASQPTSLDTVCCYEKHDILTKTPRLSASNDKALEDLHEIPLGLSDGRALNEVNSKNMSDINDKEMVQTNLCQKACDLNKTFVFKSLPKFIATLPVDFINTHHSSLQLTCANLRETKKQTVMDNCGMIWLCMSNGYVSHVALVSLRNSSAQNQSTGSQLGEAKMADGKIDIVPVVVSSGDICKSQINCAAQISCYRTRDRSIRNIERPVEDAPYGGQDEKAPVFELAIKSASPPIDIKPGEGDSRQRVSTHLSESAPSATDDLDLEQHAHSIRTNSASTSHLKVQDNDKPSMIACGRLDGPSEIHKAVCRRNYHSSHGHLRNRAIDILDQKSGRTLQSGDLHYHNIKSENRRHHVHSHHHGHQTRRHHESHGSSATHHLYDNRHSTVPLGELRKTLERQQRVPEIPYIKPKNLISPLVSKPDDIAATTMDDRVSLPESAKITGGGPVKSWNDQFGSNGRKSFRSARTLRHQASLKTSSILAKLVGSAGRKSGYLKRSSNCEKNHSDIDDIDTDNEGSKTIKNSNKNEIKASIDSNMAALTVPASSKCQLNSRDMESNPNLVSPLSSMSSLNSTHSSITVNSACGSSTGENCNLSFPLWSSTTCCAAPRFSRDFTDSTPDPEGQPLRSRSATVPCRSLCGLSYEQPSYSNTFSKCHASITNNSYKVSEIASDLREIIPCDHNSKSNNKDLDQKVRDSDLWLGCDDGSLIIIDCLSGVYGDTKDTSPVCDNKHTEIKLNAPICDIRIYLDKLVFVALSNGQLAIFQRLEDMHDDSLKNFGWSLKNPKLLNITTNELNSTSRLCLINDNYLWYSYGRNIFVLNIMTLKLETTIMAPTNDLSLQFTMQSITIDNMELMSSLPGVWISFKNSHLIQFYEANTYKLMVEINLFDPINKVLLFGNEIIRQHKTACLKATALLNVNNPKDNHSTLFVGTSAGIILTVNINNDMMNRRDSSDCYKIDLSSRITTMRHGHSGHIKFLHVIQMNNTDNYLISGGSGIDLYGPNDEQSIAQSINNDEDNSNYLLLWKLQS